MNRRSTNVNASTKADQSAKMAELSANFDQMLRDDLIPVPPDFYEEELYNEDPQYVSEIFGQLEDKNLQFIKKMQEAEKNLEKRKHDFAWL